ncbi:hypothetical protein UZ36_06060 [Candidatus Nitromaritima sp. SCGC AAA799-C22]|nr:hypothetical protein UZ36_06060 [Candidatus Nitromaritima sp. SCGC AAA799-C22]
MKQRNITDQKRRKWNVIELKAGLIKRKHGVYDTDFIIIHSFQVAPLKGLEESRNRVSDQFLN